MRTSKILIAGLAILWAGANPAWATDLPVWRTVPIDHVYAPLGVDTNDDAQVVISAHFPNLCYQSPKVVVQMVGSEARLTLQAMVNEKTSGCPRALVPVLEPVNLGALAHGTYSIKINSGTSGEMSTELLVVEAATSALDNYIYANLHAVERVANSRKVLLKGYNPSDCFEFDHVQFISNGRDTYSVLPILRQVRDRCPMKMIPMTIEAEVPPELTAPTVLLHVRVMAGRSINALFSEQGLP